jgi:acyl-CoA synthetase (AMP-forming)/AMP-acid ligase II
MIINSAERIKEFTEKGWWGDQTFKDLLLRNVERAPNEIALVDPANRAEVTDGPVRRLTYAELREQVERLALRLIEHGLGKDDILAVQLPNTVELAMVYLAAAYIGAIVTPFPWQYREYELEQLVNFVEAKVFLTATRIGQHPHAAMVAALCPKLPTLQSILAWGENAPEGVVAFDEPTAQPHDPAALDAYVRANPVDANDIVTICWTSGTEGRPKGVPRSYNDWLVPAMGTMDAAEPHEGWRILNPFPLTAMGGIAGMFCTWLLTGGTLVQHHPLSLPTFLQQIAVERIEFTVAPPVLLNMLLQNQALLAQADLSSLRVIGSGSAPLSPWMVKTWQEQYNIPVINYFGSNEGITIVGSHRDIPDPATRATLFPRFGSPHHHWTNRVAGWMRTKIVDVDGTEIDQPGLPGEMCVWGPAVFAGYYRAPELTAGAIDANGYYHTGDVFEIAEEDGDPRYFRYIGRLKDIIIRGGMNISSEEVETLIQAHPAVAEVAVVGYPDAIMGEKVCACIAPRPGQSVGQEEIAAFLQEKRVAAYKIPERVMVFEALPRNPMGKLIKRDLRERVKDAEA